MDIRPDQPELRRSQQQRLRSGETRRSDAPERSSDSGRAEQARTQAYRAEQARIDQARAGGGPEVDRIDLSEGARAAERLSGETSPDRLEALRELYQSGRLNSPERIEAAAAKILGKRAD